jgi:Flp pilus assembly secretin CpaC
MPKIFFLEADYYQDKIKDRILTIGKGEIITSEKDIERVAVSDPNIADLQVLTQKQLLARAKQLGECTFLIWEKDKTSPSRFDISVWPDIVYLTKQLKEIDEGISVEYIPPSSSSITGSSSSQGGSQQSTSPPNQGGTPAGGASQALSAANSSSQQSGGSGQANTSGKIILKGTVKNAEVIARALQIAGAYVGDQGIKIISQPGGQVVDGLSGNYKLDSNSDVQTAQSSQGSSTSFGTRDPIKFTTNRFANLSRGTIVTTQNGSVLSFLTVKDPPQISVAIRFYEVKRDLSKNLGLNATLTGSTIQTGSFVGGNISMLFGGIGSISRLGAFMGSQGNQGPEFTFGDFKSPGGTFIAQELGEGATGIIFNPKNGIGAVIQALQSRGEVKTLAEPNLVIANGEPASFLAGGEVPIIRSVFTAGGASQDVTYEPFGIRLTILPTITSNDKIFLQLSPEIRDIDTTISNLVVPPGSTSVRPPAFRTRRTQTQVELESGQAFVISGLLREDNTRNLRKVPGIGDMPVLGSLFRSKAFRKDETELLIVVTPQIVKPTTPDTIAKKELGIPEVPYNEFNQLTPLRPNIKLDDEKGPEMKKPFNPIKYNDTSNDQATPQEESKNDTHHNIPLSNNLQNNNTISLANVDRKETHETVQNPIVKEEVKFISEQQKLQKLWEIEVQKYAQAKEAMKLARTNR